LAKRLLDRRDPDKIEHEPPLIWRTRILKVK
jgi:hypothetical protein